MPKIKRKNTMRLEKGAPCRMENIGDLIRLEKSGYDHKNIDMIMLRRIISHLRELDSLVGMDSLKKSVFYQIIYYLQGLNRDHNEEYLHTIIMGNPGCGKCLAKDTQILMFDGTTKMVQDVVVGDVLIGDDSGPRNVLSVCSGSEKLYTISQSYGNSYRVNGEHILSLKLSHKWYVVSENKHTRRIGWCDADGKHTKIISNDSDFVPTIAVGDVIDISVRDYLSKDEEWRNNFAGFKVATEFQHNEVKVDPYFVGFWIGDCNNENTKLRTTKDINIYFIRYIRNMRSYVRYDINGLLLNKDVNENRELQLFTQLKSYNLINNKCIPNHYRANSRDIRLKFLSGLFDSTIRMVTTEPNTIKIAVRWRELADDIVFLCRSLGFVSEVESVKIDPLRKNYVKTDYYHIVCVIGNLCDIPCKRAIKNIVGEYSPPLMYSINVSEDEADEGEYYGFELNGNGRFLLDDFTVTHNTTVARILGKIYTSMGILSSNGNFRTAYRNDFIGEYLGHTAIKTLNLLHSCIGGVPFIDEVYSLAPRDRSNDPFSKEALDTLTSFLSEHKDDFCCIAAGYEKDIYDCFFNMNSGLLRRFPWIHRIDEYSSENLSQIFIDMVHAINWGILVENNYIVKLMRENKDMFPNLGGSVEVFLSKCKMAHAKRVFCLDDEHKFFLIDDDLYNGMQMMRETLNIKQENVSHLMMYS